MCELKQLQQVLNILQGPLLLYLLPYSMGRGWEMTCRHIFWSLTGSLDQLFTEINRLPFSLVVLYLPLSTIRMINLYRRRRWSGLSTTSASPSTRLPVSWPTAVRPMLSSQVTGLKE